MVKYVILSILAFNSIICMETGKQLEPSEQGADIGTADTEKVSQEWLPILSNMAKPRKNPCYLVGTNGQRLAFFIQRDAVGNEFPTMPQEALDNQGKLKDGWKLTDE